MEPSLEDGDVIFMSRFLAQTGAYERGDIVVFRYDEDGRAKTVLKRVVAVAGDHIRLLEDGGVELNGTRIDEDYAVGQTTGAVDLTIGDGEVFVMGDNRELSFDSRQMGAISSKKLVGKVIVRFYPFQKITKF